MNRQDKITALLVIGIGAFITIAIVLQKFEAFKRLATTVQSQSVSSGVLDYGTKATILKRLNLFTVSENDYQRFKPTKHQEETIETLPFQKKRQVGDYLYTANPGEKSALDSTELLRDIEPKANWPIISIAVHDSFLHDPETGILANREQKGRQWEKIADITYLEDGEVLFETRVGLRMHGGKRLTTGAFTPGFRLYFRKKYGLEQVPDGLILPDLEVPLRTVVLQTSAWPPGYPLNNQVAYDIARRIGGQVPTTRLVEIYLNGEHYSMGFATEHLSHRQWAQRFGDSDYFFVKYRSKSSNRDLVSYRRKLGNLLDEPTRLTIENISEAVDLDNLTAQIIAWAFCGTGDYCQGVATAEHDNPASKISWITWDMDHSFWDGSAINYGLDRENWQQPAFEGFFKQSKRRSCWRQHLFSRLIDHDEAYQTLFLQQLMSVLNHRLTPAYLNQLLDYYGSMLADYGEPHEQYMAMLTTFMERRPSFIIDEMRDHFDLSGPFSCRVTIPAGAEITIDGHRYRQTYQGTYFPNTPITLKFSETNPSFSGFHWSVNGKQLDDRNLHLVLEEDTEIILLTEPPINAAP